MSDAPEPHETGTTGKSLMKLAAPIPARHLHWPGWLALVLAIVALILVIAGWVNFSKSQEIRTARLDADLQAMNQRLDALTQSVASKSELNNEIAATQENLKSFGDRLDSMDAALTDLRRRSEQGRDAWVKAEAATLLMAANDQIQLNADPALALKALAAADERLKLLSDPRLIPVRQQIARDETALRAVPQPDVTGMSAMLASLSSAVARFPLKRVAPNQYVPGAQVGPSDNDSQTLWQRFKAGLDRITRDIFTVRHRDTPIEPLLAPQEEYFLRQNLQLRLDAARAALLERDNAAFQSSAHMARDWLETYFNTRDSGVRTAISQLAQMQQQQIAPPLPDISASLTLLRRLEPPRNTAP
ncbi:MAG: uroporphyrinogen-III C-methyltransferase [Gammaproteobacteria bacterium]